jgi:hypothetical protein
MNKKNYEPLEVRHQNITQGYYVVDRSNGFRFKNIEIEGGSFEPELFETEEKAQEVADELNKPSVDCD